MKDANGCPGFWTERLAVSTGGLPHGSILRTLLHSLGLWAIAYFGLVLTRVVTSIFACMGYTTPHLSSRPRERARG